MASEGDAAGMEAEALMKIEDTQVFRVTREGEEGKFAHEELMTGTMVVARTAEGDRVFLVMGAETYPLMEGAPVLRVGPRTFMAPTSADGSTSIGLTIATPPVEVVEEFAAVVASICALHNRTDDGQCELEDAAAAAAAAAEAAAEAAGAEGGAGGADLATRVADGLEVGSKKVAAGVVAGGKVLGSAVGKGGAWLKGKVGPKAKAVEPSARTKATVAAAKVASESAVVVTAAMLDGLTLAATGLAKAGWEAAKGTETGAKLASRGESKSGEAVKHVAGAGVVALTTVLLALDQAGTELVRETGKTTAELVDHRYGPEAGAVARDAAAAGTNLYKAGINVRKTGVTSLARAAATNVAREELAKPDPAPSVPESMAPESAEGK